MRVFLPTAFLLFALTGHSQTVIDVGKNDVQVGSRFYVVNDGPVSNTKYVRVIEGSPYFNESWMKGKLMLSGGRVYDSIRLRLDLLENALQYISPDGRELIATTPVKEVTLTDSFSGEEYHFTHASFLQMPKNMDHGWYQMLAAGPVTLYKHAAKVLNENKPYGSATIEQTIKTFNQYFIVVNAVFTQVKKIKELPELLNDKKTELTAFISSKNLSGKSDTDYSSLIAYYNSLVAK